MYLRWYVKEEKKSYWNSRWDEVEHYTIKHRPILQISQNSIDWFDVPTVTEVIDDNVQQGSTIPL